MQIVVVYGPPGRALDQYAAMIKRTTPDVRVATMAVPDGISPTTADQVRQAILTDCDPDLAPVLAKAADLVLQLGMERAARRGTAQAEELNR